jgi:hypothetical protein
LFWRLGYPCQKKVPFEIASVLPGKLKPSRGVDRAEEDIGDPGYNIQFQRGIRPKFIDNV